MTGNHTSKAVYKGKTSKALELLSTVQKQILIFRIMFYWTDFILKAPEMYVSDKKREQRKRSDLNQRGQKLH